MISMAITQTAPAVTTRQYHDANTKIMDIFACLQAVINSVDSNHAYGQALRNANDVFPMAERIVEAVGASTQNIHEAYIRFIENNNHAQQSAAMIEHEAWQIFREIQDVALHAQKISINPESNVLRYRAENTYHEELRMQETFDRSLPAPTHVLQENRRGDEHKTGSTQTALIQEARRLGPEYGAQFLLAMDDMFLSLVAMLQAVKSAGMDIDLAKLPNTHTHPQIWAQSKQSRLRSTGIIAANIQHLVRLMEQRREECTKQWTTRRGR